MKPFTETQTIFKIETTLAEIEYHLHLLADIYKSSSPLVISNVLGYSRNMSPPQKRLRSAIDNILKSYRNEGAILVDGTNIDYYEQLYSSLNAWKSVWNKTIATNSSEDKDDADEEYVEAGNEEEESEDDDLSDGEKVEEKDNKGEGEEGRS